MVSGTTVILNQMMMISLSMFDGYELLMVVLNMLIIDLSEDCAHSWD